MVFVTLSRKHSYAQKPIEGLTSFADENVDDLGNVSDDFQETFFEALKQKGIQNYDRAIAALDKCIAMEPKQSILYFERGKNHVFLKNYDSAVTDFNEYLNLKPNDKDVLQVLYDVQYKQRDYESAEITIKQLIPFDSQYKEDLARIYTNTKRYDEALDLIEALDNEKGPDVYRNKLKERLYTLSNNTDRKVKELENNVAANPESKEEYLKLIYVYSEQGDIKKAYETALELQKIDPEADEVQLALYKFYLNDKKTDQAVVAMQRVLKSKSISPEAKHSVLNDFVGFVNKNPEFEPQLEEAITVFDTQIGDANINQELAKYYIKKGNKVKALPYLEKALGNEPENLEIIKDIVLLQLDAGQNQAAEKTASDALELFPSQPLLYLTYGVALNKQSKFEAAIDQLELGIDYLIDDTKMEEDFYKQLGDAYTGKGDATKASRYYDKATSLQE